ncbi:OmpA family protein [Echinicola sp. CAU 1574]|uniref:OmpA family protein n=1 Tax=Echinicola arenosa TaxID=2774144 RepID=A0ABR9ALZ4_9BACT|nr:OmpA family protein [Echinicola arenosa]MBD8489823.1 OmpA family protein [Echinicola arenosa]
MKIFTLTTIVLVGVISYATAQSQPPVEEAPTESPSPGKCYVKCITPDEFQDETVTVIVEPEYSVLVTYPATYKTVEDRVIIKEASKELRYVPAVYETIEVPYISKEEAQNLKVIPASFGDDLEEVETYPMVGRWEYRILEDCPSVDKEDCMVACYVEYPSKSETVPTQTLVADASTAPIPIPEENATYKKQVVRTPARMEEIEIPAEYATITRQVVDQPARTEKEVVPAVTKTITKTVLVNKGGMTVWEEVDCELVGNINLLPILYELNSARLTPESEDIIDEHLLALMEDSPALRIEIMSHTDSRGSDDYNMSLSQQRAQSVVNYLVNKGISRNRLVAKGYGETRLINKCANGVDCPESMHHENRRTEFRIIQ